MTDIVLYEKRGSTAWITLNRPEAGLVSRLVPRMALLDAAEKLAQRIADNAPLSVLLVKEAVRGSLETDLSTGLRLEADFSTLIASTEDRKEAGAAFREKRKPKFEGK